MGAVIVLRATKKVLRFLGPTQETDPKPSDTALGDWYVNRIVVDAQPLLVILSSLSLLTIIEPARGLRALATRLPELVGARLGRLGIAPSIVEAELSVMNPVLVAPTRDPVVLGYLVDFAKAVSFYLPIKGWDTTTLPFVESRLAETPCHLGKTTFPETAAKTLLAERWNVA